ncbi:MAG: hypothetical protein ABSH51_08630 [Solirubrobacteraceae bacterium]|jgi:hypothetical protein
MRRCSARIVLVAAVVAIACAGALTTVALASGNAVINDCQDNGRLTQTYSRAQLEHALSVMSASVKTYSDCQSLIQQALANLAGGHGGTGGSGGGGSFLPTPVIVILVLLILAAIAFGGLALRRRRDGADAAPTEIQPPDDD